MGHGHRTDHDRFGNPGDLRAYLERMEAADRAEWQRPQDVIAALGELSGKTVADVGAGPGYFTVPLSRAVGERGRIFAAEVEPRLLLVLRERIAQAKAGNVTPVLAGPADPYLPPRSCDLVLVVDTFHHFPDGVDYLRKLARLLRPRGRIANVDFHEGPLPVGPSPEHKVSRADFLRQAAAAGLALAEEHSFLPHQYFVVLRPATG